MSAVVRRVTAPSGDPAWHVTGYHEVRALLADRDVGRGHPEPARAGRYSKDDIAGRPAAGSATEHADHALWRKAMNATFSPAALERLTPTVETVAARVVEDLAAAPRPADLNPCYGTPLTSEVMCTLLGVPTDDVGRFRSWSEEGAQTTDLARSMNGMNQLMGYAARMVHRRRSGGGDDPVSVLLDAGDGTKAHAGRVVKLLAGMLAFGRETPASVIDHGTLLLLTHPEQRRRFQADPGLLATTVEEVLRLFRPHAATDHGLLRYAHVDRDVGDVHVRAGDMLLLDVVAANRDPAVFPEPERFDVGRTSNPHLTFGYGAYMCNFTRLGRAEIGVGLRTLFDRLPTLALAADPDHLRERDHLRTGGLERLPVTW